MAIEQIRLYRDGEYAVVSVFSNGTWQDVTRATFDLLRDPHYVGAFENPPQETAVNPPATPAATS